MTLQTIYGEILNTENIKEDSFKNSSISSHRCHLMHSWLGQFYLRYVVDILAAFDNEQDSLNLKNVLNNRHSNIKFTIEKQINHSIAFLDVLISGVNNQNLKLQTYHKSTYTGLLLNFKSFTSFSYKISLMSVR